MPTFQEPRALASTNAILEAAGCFESIANALHRSLLRLTDLAPTSTEKIYALITEEYGLRTRLGILRGDAKNRIVEGVSESQNEFINLLSDTTRKITDSNSVEEIGLIINSVSALCVSIYPGKHKTIEFLITNLRDSS